MRRFSSAEV